MAQAGGAFGGQRLLAFGQARPAAGRPHRVPESTAETLDDLVEATRAIADGAVRIEDNTLEMIDQLGVIENRLDVIRLGGIMFAVGQVAILSLILWRVW